MNVGQILETHLGWACSELGENMKKLVNENQKKVEKNEKISNFLKSVYGKEIFSENLDKLSKTEFKDLCENLQNGVPISTPVFDGAKEQDVTNMLDLATLPKSGQTMLWDGRTGEKFDREVTVGTIYMLKLHHLWKIKSMLGQLDLIVWLHNNHWEVKLNWVDNVLEKWKFGH